MFRTSKDDKVGNVTRPQSNWLPTSPNGLFLLVLRTYIPGKEILEQKYAVPPVKLVEYEQ
jgi:hypothetical protein